jgi:hypothetical protein
MLKIAKPKTYEAPAIEIIRVLSDYLLKLIMMLFILAENLPCDSDWFC